jgi:hypothetical protein
LIGQHALLATYTCYSKYSGSYPCSAVSYYSTWLFAGLALVVVVFSLLTHQGYRYRAGKGSIFGTRGMRTVLDDEHDRQMEEDTDGMALVAEARRESGLPPEGGPGGPGTATAAGAVAAEHLPAFGMSMGDGGAHPGAQHPGAQHPGTQHPGAQHPGTQHPRIATSWSAGGGAVAPTDSIDIVSAVDAAEAAGRGVHVAAGWQDVPGTHVVAPATQVAPAAQPEPAAQTAPAGWYADPEVPGQQRYWSGTAWSPSGAGPPA